MKKLPLPLSFHIDRFIKKNHLQKNIFGYKACRLFEQIWGESHKVWIREVSYNKEKESITVKVSNTAFKNEILTNKDKIIKTIVKDLGADLLKDIKVY